MTVTMDGFDYDGTPFTGRTLTYTWTGLNNPSWAFQDAVLEGQGVPTNSYAAGGSVSPTLIMVDSMPASLDQTKQYQIFKMENGDWNQDGVGGNTRLAWEFRPVFPGMNNGTGQKPGPFEPGSTLTIQQVAFTQCVGEIFPVDDHTMTFAAGWDGE
ncbi:MAG: hypothetical protein GY888_30910, partial [Planctomycetaceae bacterium]|nr:hypothetical protein [Planctomycetaceae bacterium]